MLNSMDSSSASLSRMQQHYWTTKQAVFQKLGKKDDDCIISSDVGLDLKLELFQTIEESFLTLMRVLESYQDKLCVLAQEENVLGRFLKEQSKLDKTKAGIAMCNAGKALSYSAQQRLSLRVPLIRLYQEVETFQYRAIVDTLQTIEKMEKARTSYRGTLMWMKDASQQLDPETCKQLTKFKKVQSKVRRAKYLFDNLKLDTLQKIDLLSFSRCNLFSQALLSYQISLRNLGKRAAYISHTVAKTTKGYQHYEFSMLKELTETSKKLEESVEQKFLSENDIDSMIFLEADYHDEIDGIKPEKREKTSCKNHFAYDIPTDCYNGVNKSEKNHVNIKNDEEMNDSMQLLYLTENDSLHNKSLNANEEETSNPNDSETYQLTKEFKSIEGSASSNKIFDDNDYSNQWQFPFYDCSLMHPKSVQESGQNISTKPSYLPSELLNMNFNLSALTNVTGGSDQKECVIGETKPLYEMKRCKQDMSAWFNLFADLDPLANPDLIDKKEDDRSC